VAAAPEVVAASENPAEAPAAPADEQPPVLVVGAAAQPAAAEGEKQPEETKEAGCPGVCVVM
jgi:hypothetical protein